MAPCLISDRFISDLAVVAKLNTSVGIGCKELGELEVVQVVVVVVVVGGEEWVVVVEGEHPSLTSYPSEPTIVSLGRNAALFLTISNISLRIAPSAATSAELLSISGINY